MMNGLFNTLICLGENSSGTHYKFTTTIEILRAGYFFFCLVSWRCKFWVVCSSGLLHLYYQCWQILCLLVFVITLTVFFILESIFWHLCKKGRKVNNLQLLGFVAHSGVGRKIWSNIHVHWPLLLRSFEYNENIFNSCIFMVILIRREKIWQLEAAYVPIFLWREILLKNFKHITSRGYKPLKFLPASV